MPRPRNEKPSLCHHKPTGLAYVRLPGCKPVYCGRWGSQEGRDKYDVVVAEWIKRGRLPLPQSVQTSGGAGDVRDAGPTITMVIEPYWKFAHPAIARD